MVIPRLFIEHQIILTKKGYRVMAHERPRRSIFTIAKPYHFDTLEEANAWIARVSARHNADRKTTESVLWVSDSLVPTLPYSTLPRLDSDGKNLWLNGTLIVSNARSGREAWDQMKDFPLAAFLKALPCRNCGRIPTIRLHAGTLEHNVKGCRTAVSTIADPLTPLPMQISVWNRKLYRRNLPATLLPMTRPHFMVLGALREPTENDFFKKIRKIETMEL